MREGAVQYVPIRSLSPLDSPVHQRIRPALRSLSDEQLLQAVHFPRYDDYLVINTRTGKLHDGNGRAIELLCRASDPSSSIQLDTQVPVEYYEPDYSMFPDLNA